MFKDAVSGKIFFTNVIVKEVDQELGGPKNFEAIFTSPELYDMVIVKSGEIKFKNEVEFDCKGNDLETYKIKCVKDGISFPLLLDF